MNSRNRVPPRSILHKALNGARATATVLLQILGFFLVAFLLFAGWAVIAGIWGGMWGQRIHDSFALTETLWTPLIVGIGTTLFLFGISIKQQRGCLNTAVTAIENGGKTTVVAIGIYAAIVCISIIGNQLIHAIRTGIWRPYSLLDVFKAYGLTGGWIQEPKDWIGLHWFLDFIHGAVGILVIAIVAFRLLKLVIDDALNQ